jgi:dihydrofolate reductase
VSKVIVDGMSMSVDGYTAGPDQSFENPLGINGRSLHEWMSVEAGTAGDNDPVVGATIMGRNMFSPHRGPWPDDAWNGWWGVNPPFHRPVFVLTHYPRPDVVMEGGTSFHFVTDGVESALARARVAAAGNDISVSGAATIQQFLRARLIDELYVIVVPVLLGSGVTLFENLGDGADAFDVGTLSASSGVAHVRFRRTP